jgi:hypothetical protein
MAAARKTDVDIDSAAVRSSRSDATLADKQGQARSLLARSGWRGRTGCALEATLPSVHRPPLSALSSSTTPSPLKTFRSSTTPQPSSSTAPSPSETKLRREESFGLWRAATWIFSNRPAPPRDDPERRRRRHRQPVPHAPAVVAAAPSCAGLPPCRLTVEEDRHQQDCFLSPSTIASHHNSTSNRGGRSVEAPGAESVT